MSYNTPSIPNSLKVSKPIDAAASNRASKVEERKSAKAGGLDPTFLAWYEMLQSVNIEEQTAEVQADELNKNANIQQGLNTAVDQVNFVQITSKESSTQVLISQTENQQNQKIMDDYTNRNIVERQLAQVLSTKANTSTNNTEQTEQEGSSILQLLVSLTNQLFR